METLDHSIAKGTAGQKRSGTVLFADVVGFTSFAERLGEEPAFEMIRAVSSKMQEAIHAEGGTVGEFRGDGIMALFGVTTGLEDAPLAACRAALRIQTQVADASAAMARRYGEAPQVRVGLHCGPLVVGNVGDAGNDHVTIIGDAANVASRLEALADAGQVVISDDLLALVEGQVEARDLGDHALKGKAQRQQVYLLESIRDATRFEASEARGLSTLMDRETELAALAQVRARARAGQIAVANICGEPGIGKSRLIHEFQRDLNAEGIRVLKGNCRTEGASLPFLPFAEILSGALGIDAATPTQNISRRIDALLRDMQIEVEEVRPYLLALLGKSRDIDLLRNASADMIGARMRQVIIDLLRRRARTRSLVLIVEDLHWADSGTLEVIDQLIRTDDSIPLMIICSFRPHFRAAWDGLPNTTLIAPQPINSASVGALIREVLPRTDEKMIALAIEKADGNPLYAEEIARFLSQRSSIGEADLVLPANVQNMVMDRFDKLDPGCRDLLQAASAIGRRFDARLAHGVIGGSGAFAPSQLAAAVEAGMIHTHGTEPDHYRFKHALVRDAIYFTLLGTPRRNLHGRIAKQLEQLFSNRIEEAAEILAYHFDAAQIPAKAVPHLITAGHRNLTLFSLDAADKAFGRAFELLEDGALDATPAQTATLFVGWFEVQQWRAEFGRTLRLFESQSARLAQASDDPRYARILGLVGTAYCQNLEFARAREQLAIAIEIGERLQDRDAIIYACLGLLSAECTAVQPGYWQRTQDIIARIKAELGDDPHPYFRTYCTFYESWTHSIRGNFDHPIAQGHLLFEEGRRINFSGSIGWGSICISYNEMQMENYETAIKYASIGAAEAGGVVDRMVCLAIKGFSMLMTPQIEGNMVEGRRILQEVFDTGVRLEYRGVEAMTEGTLGLARALSGDLGGGVRELRTAIENAVKVGNLHGAAQSHVALGMIYLQLATGAEKPAFSMLVRNLPFLLREAPFAKSRAIHHFDAAAKLGREAEMLAILAQSLHGKAAALKAARKPDAARAALEQAQEAVAQVSFPIMRRRIEEDLAALG